MFRRVKLLLLISLAAWLGSSCHRKSSKQRAVIEPNASAKSSSASSSDSVVTKEIDGQVVVLEGLLAGDPTILDKIEKISPTPGDGSDFLHACRTLASESLALMEALKRMVAESDCLRAHDKLIYMREFWVTKNLTISDVALLSKLKNISLLHLSDNSLVDIGPLASLQNLEVLHLDNNMIQDISPLRSLPKLRSLNLKGNKLSDISELGGLENLTYLDLDLNMIQDLSPLGKLSRLSSLFVSGNQIVDISTIAGLKSLLHLHLSSNPIADMTPIGELKSLKVLHVVSTLTESLSPLANLTELEKLEAANTPVSRNRTLENCPVSAASATVRAFCGSL